MVEQGKIYKGIGGFYYVQTDKSLIECRARGRFRSDKITPMVGDLVEIEHTTEGKGFIKEILPRKNSFIRPPLANIDMLVIVVSEAPPVTDLYLIDSMASVAIDKGIEPLILINKIDIDPGDNLYQIYAQSGMGVLCSSAETQEGKNRILDAIKGRVSAFTGNSGVGKSSLLNMIDSRLGIKVGDLNEKLGRGRHTTRHVELFDLENGAIVGDTPGFSSFEITDADIVLKEDIQYTFPEFEPYLGQCRFTGCAHDRDKGCEIRAAVEEGSISRSRYDSYVRMYRSAMEYKPWEKKTE